MMSTEKLMALSALTILVAIAAHALPKAIAEIELTCQAMSCEE